MTHMFPTKYPCHEHYDLFYKPGDKFYWSNGMYKFGVAQANLQVYWYLDRECTGTPKIVGTEHWMESSFVSPGWPELPDVP